MHMKNTNSINWDHWAASKVAASQFEQRREPHLRYVTYTAQFDETLERIQLVCSRISTIANGTKPGGMMNSTNLRLCDLLDWLSLQYSAGAPVELFDEIWPCAMEWAEEYAQCHAAYHNSPEAGNHMTPHAALRTEDYWTMALRLVCFGLLTGNAAQMPRVMQFLDYGNEDMDVRDGLLERLVAPFVAGRGTPPDTATRHLPYRKLFKVFDAAPDKRPALMAKYLDEWYHASRREPYIDQH
ncbi:hypothetical protein IR009_23410, partial [Pseudomonas putida]|nr:hypothetical protein [Pseudomonas putida]